MTNETKTKGREEISKKRIAGRMAKNVGKDLAFLASAPLVGQLPKTMKQKIYREENTNWYDKGDRTRLSTDIAVVSNVLGGALTGGIVAYNAAQESGDEPLGAYSIVGSLFGGILGAANSLVPQFLVGDDPDPSSENKAQLKKEARRAGSLLGYVASIPLWADYGLYKAGEFASEEMKNYFSLQVRKARRELEESK